MPNMSTYREHNSPALIGRPSVLNLTVSDFLRDVCSKCNGDVEKIVDKFIEMMIQLLFKVAELLPLYTLELNRIIRTLVDYRVQCRSSLYSDNRDFENNINSLKNLSGFDLHKSANSMLYDLDKKINELQDKKFLIYNELERMRKDLSLKDVNVKMEKIDDSYKEKEISFQENNVETFHPSSIKKAAQLIKNEHIGRNVKFSNFVINKSSGQDILENKSVISVDNCNNNDRTTQEIFVNLPTTIQNLSLPILCLKVYGDVCMAGCENGQLQIFSLETGNLIDKIQAHSMPVTSLVIWNDIMVSSSLDKSLKSFNMEKSTTKRITIEHPIETTIDDSNGVLYAGTSTGKIFRFNILSVTQMGLMFHISSCKIVCMRVFHNGFKLLLAVSAENKPITIRCAETGTLLKTLQVKNIISFDICEKDKLWFGVSKDAIYTMSLNKSEHMKTVSCRNVSRICICGNLIVVCGSEGKVFISDKKLVLQHTLPIGFKDDVTSVNIWKNSVVVSYRNTLTLTLLQIGQN